MSIASFSDAEESGRVAPVKDDPPPSVAAPDDPKRISLGLLARDLHRAINQRFEEKVGQYGLAASACQYLKIIHDWNGATPKDLSAFFRVRSPTVLAALRTLEAKRFIKKTRDAQDGRKSLYKLTPRGQEIEPLLRQAAHEIEIAAVQGLSIEEVHQFRDMVLKIRASLDDTLGPFEGKKADS